MTWNKGNIYLFIFPRSHFRSDITLLLSKTGLLIYLIFLYYSVSRPCLWFLMQNSTQLLNLWPLCLCFIFNQILFLHQSYKIFSKDRINFSWVYSTAVNTADQESLFLYELCNCGQCGPYPKPVEQKMFKGFSSIRLKFLCDHFYVYLRINTLLACNVSLLWKIRVPKLLGRKRSLA